MSRYTIDFGEKFDKLLDGLASAQETTKAEIIRRAVASYAYLNHERDEGHRLQIVDDLAKTTKEVVLP
jgi:predicted transcriptional regulator